jgi:chromosome partitioning protein
VKTIVLTNQKGGVGKTTIAVHLAMALLAAGKRVLFVDIDPQANSSKTLGSNVVGVFTSQMFEESAISFDIREGINLIQADSKMVDIEQKRLSVVRNFKAHLERLNDDFDFCIIDSPPGLGNRMTSALIVADYVLSPIELEEYSIDGITKMLQTIFGVKKQFNPELQFLGMLPNRFNPRSVQQKDTLRALLKDYSQWIIPAKIGIRSSIPEALKEGIPVWESKKTSARAAAEEFQEAFQIIFQKIGIGGIVA